jgi:phenylacetate-CoA ligase
MQTLGVEEIKTLIRSPAWSKIPFMDKEALRTRTYDPACFPDTLHWFSSSGSTGTPVLYPWTAGDERVADITIKKIHAENQFPSGITAFIIAPTGLPGMWYHMDRQLRSLGLATVFPGVDSPDGILDLIQRLNPQVLISLPLVLSRLGELRALRVAQGIPVEAHLFSGGDVLSESRRNRIEQSWGAKLENFYGLSEVFGPLANESERRDVLVWQAEEIFVEILDPITRQPVSEGKTGVAVITTLWERPASLVRYWTGDCFRLVRWQSVGCPVFQMRGRQELRWPGLLPDVFPVDIDEILLADPAAGNEWTASCENEVIVLKVETTGGVDRLDQRTRSSIERMFHLPVHLISAKLGAMDRSTPKLGVSMRKAG